MINAIEIAIFIVGIPLGLFINYAIYSWAEFRRAISPWQRQDPQSQPPALSRGAYVPVVGWLYRRGESAKWGPGFWIRPMLIEAMVPISLVILYRSMMAGLTIPMAIRIPAVGMAAGGGGVAPWELQVQFLAYSLVFSLLIVATFIDIDERTIPDLITVPGTCLGLIACALLPGWCLWEIPLAGQQILVKTLEPVHANSPFAWDPSWGQNGIGGAGLWVGCAIWCAWCAALGNLRWMTRRGIGKAFVYAWAGFWRSPNLGVIFGMATIGTLLIVAVYFGMAPERWRQLFSSLMGIGLGGMLVWSFRIVAGGVMQREAMGFGDVTLMAMIGAHFGWQIVLFAFFLAPFLGIALVIVYWTITRDTAIPFGPFLAAATAYLMLDWARVWDVTSPIFLPLNQYLIFLAGLLILLGSLLWIVNRLNVLMFARGATDESTK